MLAVVNTTQGVNIYPGDIIEDAEGTPREIFHMVIQSAEKIHCYFENDTERVISAHEAVKVYAEV